MSETRHYYASHGKALVETCINDLKMMGDTHRLKIGDRYNGVMNGRREAVIILHATGLVSIHEGWNVGDDDIPELLAARVLKGDD